MAQRIQAKTRRKKESTHRFFRRFSEADDKKNLQRLKRYIKQNGTLHLEDFRESDPEFYGWYIYTQNRLSELSWDQIGNLTQSGFFDAGEKQWLKTYHKLTIFKEVMGHTRVPARWDKNRKLSRWVHQHRSDRSKTPPHLKRMLDAIGFEWKLRDQASHTSWEDRYVALVAYHERFGDCNVPAKWVEDRGLGSWVSSQRPHKELLSDVQIQKLDQLGFDWDILGNRWEKRYSELAAFYEEHGHSRVPVGYKKNPGLALWVGNIRNRLHLQSGRRIDRLNALKFDWEPHQETWDLHYARLKRYYRFHKNALIPARWARDPELATWVGTQRDEYKEGKLSRERIQKLEKLDFVWDVRAYNWNQMFQALRDFKERFGHCRVPSKRWPENPKLGSWLSTQRCSWDRLSLERRERLEALGVTQTVPHKMPENVKSSHKPKK